MFVVRRFAISRAVSEQMAAIFTAGHGCLRLAVMRIITVAMVKNVLVVTVRFVIIQEGDRTKPFFPSPSCDLPLTLSVCSASLRRNLFYQPNPWIKFIQGLGGIYEINLFHKSRMGIFTILLMGNACW